MFEVVPPGIQAMIKTPMAMASGKVRKLISRKPINGMKPYWLITPMAKP